MSAIIRTYSINMLDVKNPDPALITIEDIAHSLSIIPRFTGHTAFPYTVAQHSLWCAKLIAEPELKLDALMHDAPEAYLNDLATPIKKDLSKYMLMEGVVWSVIARKYGLPERLDARVKKVDDAAFSHEYFWLNKYNYKPHCGLYHQDFREVKAEFLALFHQLTEGKFLSEKTTA